MGLGALRVFLLAALAAAAPSRFFDGAPAELLRAFASGDGVAFVAAAQRAEYVPPEGDDAQARLYAEGLERREAERLYAREIRPALEFQRQLRRYPSLRLDPFAHTEIKREILLRVGYTALNGQGGRPIPLAAATPRRIGGAFQSAYRRFSGTLGRH